MKISRNSSFKNSYRNSCILPACTGKCSEVSHSLHQSSDLPVSCTSYSSHSFPGASTIWHLSLLGAKTHILILISCILAREQVVHSAWESSQPAIPYSQHSSVQKHGLGLKSQHFLVPFPGSLEYTAHWGWQGIHVWGSWHFCFFRSSGHTSKISQWWSRIAGFLFCWQQHRAFLQ